MTTGIAVLGLCDRMLASFDFASEDPLGHVAGQRRRADSTRPMPSS